MTTDEAWWAAGFGHQTADRLDADAGVGHDFCQRLSRLVGSDDAPLLLVGEVVPWLVGSGGMRADGLGPQQGLTDERDGRDGQAHRGGNAWNPFLVLEPGNDLVDVGKRASGRCRESLPREHLLLFSRREGDAFREKIGMGAGQSDEFVRRQAQQLGDRRRLEERIIPQSSRQGQVSHGRHGIGAWPSLPVRVYAAA